MTCTPTTTISYSIPVDETGYASSVQLKIYDILGREIATLVNEQQKSEYYEVEWNAAELTSEIYLYQLRAGYSVQVKKLMLMK